MTKYFARKTPCQHGHTHASAKEAKRCNALHQLYRASMIDALVVEPVYKFTIAGSPLKMLNGRQAQYTPDFSYIENGKVVCEDVKASNGFMSRDVPLRLALFRHLFPEIELRVVK